MLQAPTYVTYKFDRQIKLTGYRVFQNRFNSKMNLNDVNGNIYVKLQNYVIITYVELRKLFTI